MTVAGASEPVSRSVARVVRAESTGPCALVGTTVGAREVPLAIDELPLFALAAACARGESTLVGAEELRGGRMSSRGDHRHAMLGAVAGLASREGVRIEGAGAVAVSFPGFFEIVEELRRTSVVVEDERR